MGDSDEETSLERQSREPGDSGVGTSRGRGGLRSGTDPKNPSAALELQIQVNQLKKEVKGKKSHLTKNINLLTAQLETLDPTTASVVTLPQIREHLKLINKYSTQIVDLYYDWINLQEDKEEEFLAQISATNERVLDITLLAQRFLARVPSPGGNDPQAAPLNAGALMTTDQGQVSQDG